MLYAKYDATDPNAILKPLSQGTDEEIAAVASELFHQYHADYNSLGLFERFKNNETYIRGDHWDLVASDDENEPRPHTPVLWSTIDNIHADLIEAYPRCSPQAETVKDTQAVRMAGDIQTASFSRRGFKKVWAQATKGVLTQGLDYIEVFWDKTLYNGVGDVNYRRWSVRHILHDPFVADLNDSEALFVMNFERLRSIQWKYPEKREQISSCNSEIVKPSDITGGTKAIASTAEKDMVLVLEFYWREFTMQETELGMAPEYKLCWAKIAGGVVVERSKNTGKSVYAHAEYPLIPLQFEETDGSLFSLGLVDRFKRMQWFVDKMDQCVLKNIMASARNKILYDESSGIDAKALKDWSTELISGKDISERAVRWFDNKPFTNAPMIYSQDKAASIKDESGANQFNRGEGGRGVTAASAIYALQEAGSKRSRKTIDMLYDAVSKVCWQALELQYEFYTEDRLIAIADDGGKLKDQKVSASTFKASNGEGILDMRMRMNAEHDTGYKTALRNQQAIDLMNSRVIDQQVGLQMMEFDDKDRIMEFIRQLETSEVVQLRQTVAQLEQQLQVMSKQTAQSANFRPPMQMPPELDQEQNDGAQSVAG